MEGPLGRQRLGEAIERAVADHVCGSPYFLVDGEGFFGADRLPQIAWRLGQAARH
jgi:2-hydroxychromene-2-carboxylate isomerase